MFQAPNAALSSRAKAIQSITQATQRLWLTCKSSMIFMHLTLACFRRAATFTMDMRRVAYAAKKFFKFKTLIPGHYRTFPILEQSADLLVRELPEVEVIEPEVLEPIRFT